MCQCSLSGTVMSSGRFLSERRIQSAAHWRVRMVAQYLLVERYAETDLGRRGVVPAFEPWNCAVNCAGEQLAFADL